MPKINDLKLKSLKVNEIFTSISGETGGIPQGSIATFIRFAGCNMQCYFCDTAHTQKLEKGNYSIMTGQSIFEVLRNHPARHVILTGGEPLLQLLTRHGGLLVRSLSQAGYTVTVETNGSIAPVPETHENKMLFRGVNHWVVDMKMPYLHNKMQPMSVFFPVLTYNWNSNQGDKTLTYKFMVANESQFREAYEMAFLNHMRLGLRMPELLLKIKYAFSAIPDYVQERNMATGNKYWCERTKIKPDDLLKLLLKKLREEPQDEPDVKSFQKSIILNTQLHKLIEVA